MCLECNFPCLKCNYPVLVRLTEEDLTESVLISTGGWTHSVTLLHSLGPWSLGEPWGVGMGVAAV